MESSTTFDIPPVLKPDLERRLVRVFVYLRQHDRKTRLTKKLAELSALKEPTKRADRVNNQQDLAERPKEVIAPTASESEAVKTKETVVKILEEEVEELQRTINFKDFDTSGSISAADLSSALRALNRPTPKAEVQWIIWEVDDDLDGAIDWNEFRGAYARCVVDKQGIEPNQLFHLTHFMLSDPDGGASVSVADVRTELQRVRGTEHLANKIKKALGSTSEQQDQERHSLGPYLDAVLTRLPASFVVGTHFQPKQ